MPFLLQLLNNVATILFANHVNYLIWIRNIVSHLLHAIFLEAHLEYLYDYDFHVMQNLSTPEDLSAYDGIELRVKGDGRRYKLIVRTSSEWDTVGYTAGFDTVEDQWQTVHYKLRNFTTGTILFATQMCCKLSTLSPLKTVHPIWCTTLFSY